MGASESKKEVEPGRDGSEARFRRVLGPLRGIGARFLPAGQEQASEELRKVEQPPGFEQEFGRVLGPRRGSDDYLFPDEARKRAEDDNE
jgi:hypothetical protein